MPSLTRKHRKSIQASFKLFWPFQANHENTEHLNNTYSHKKGEQEQPPTENVVSPSFLFGIPFFLQRSLCEIHVALLSVPFTKKP